MDFLYRKRVYYLKIILLSLILLLICSNINGIILFGSGDPTYNSVNLNPNIPGAKYIGYWEGTTGVPVSSNCFITSRHVNGKVGNKFIFQKKEYEARQVFYSSTNAMEDLAIWRVDGVFPLWAPIYQKTNEDGKIMIIFGRGTQRGDPIIITNKLCGWKFGNSDGVLRWGKNKIIEMDDLLGSTFDEYGGPNECFISFGDSGGPSFIQDTDGEWKLSGVNFFVLSVKFSYKENGEQFFGAVFDMDGLFLNNNFVNIPLTSSFYISRISTKQKWIETVIKL